MVVPSDTMALPSDELDDNNHDSVESDSISEYNEVLNANVSAGMPQLTWLVNDRPFTPLPMLPGAYFVPGPGISETVNTDHRNTGDSSEGVLEVAEVYPIITGIETPEVITVYGTVEKWIDLRDRRTQILLFSIFVLLGSLIATILTFLFMPSPTNKVVSNDVTRLFNTTRFPSKVPSNVPSNVPVAFPTCPPSLSPSRSFWNLVGSEIYEDNSDLVHGIVSLSADASHIAVTYPFFSPSKKLHRIYKLNSREWGIVFEFMTCHSNQAEPISLSSNMSAFAVSNSTVNRSCVKVFNINRDDTYLSRQHILPEVVEHDCEISGVSMSDNGTLISFAYVRMDSNKGRVMTYEYHDSGWELRSILEGRNILNETFHLLGLSMVMSKDGSVLAVSAVRKQEANRISKERIFLFEDKDGSWIQSDSYIERSVPEQYGAVSLSLSHDGKRVAVGSGGNDVYEDEQTSIYEYNPSTLSWSKLGNSVAGEILSMSGNGLYFAVSSGTSSGKKSVKIYGNSGTEWLPVGQETFPKLGSKYMTRIFYLSLSFDGTRFAVSGICERLNLSEARSWVSVYSLD